MKKYFLIIFILFVAINDFAQTSTFDVFTYLPPEFFTKTELPSRLQFSLANKDGSFCLITLYKSQPAKEDILKDISSQWNEQVVKRLNKADKKPGRILTEQLWDGWATTLAIGNYFQNKKKCVIMLNSFRKDNQTVSVVFEMSDKNFKGVVEKFSANLKLKNNFPK
jgi:hypothetical protein